MTLVIAHRTCPRHAPENSLDGIARAAELGADAVEMDVRLTREGVPVLLHDPLLWRTAHVPVPVRWAGGPVVRLARRRGGMPLLADALVAARRRGLRPVLDVKAAACAAAVVRLLEASGDGPVSLWSQHGAAVAEFARCGLGTDDIALLRDTSSTRERERLLVDAERLGATAVSAHWDAVDATFVRQAGDAGLQVHSWCQWRDRHAEKAGLGLAGVVTDWPDVARRVGL